MVFYKGAVDTQTDLSSCQSEPGGVGVGVGVGVWGGWVGVFHVCVRDGW